jgi:hypothetical protein
MKERKIKNCKECPCCHSYQASFDANYITYSCGFDYSMGFEDNTKIPKRCPLRKQSVLLKIVEENK